MTRCLALIVATLALFAFYGPAHAGTETIPTGGPQPLFPFEDCGVLQFGLDGNDCWFFITHNGGIYTIENTAGFDDGDAVCVTGQVAYHQCYTVCGPVTGCVFDNTITDQFADFGTYGQGFECGALVTESGATYQIVGPLPDGIEPGDPIHVEGTLNAQCFSFCDLICIDDAIVRTVFAGAGTLGPGPQGCPLFTGDDGDLFLIENLDGFLPNGERVYVSGAVEESSLLCLPPIWPGLLDNSVGVYFEGCGLITPGPQGCLGFTADSGEGFTLFGNVGEIGMFDRYYMAGIVHPQSTQCFPVTTTALEVVLSAPCNPADVNGDGGVNVGDLVAVITAWGPCPDGCAADITGDNVVGIDDLVAVIVAWDG